MRKFYKKQFLFQLLVKDKMLSVTQLLDRRHCN